MKVCTKCKTLKDISLFPKNEKMNDGSSSWCRACFREYHRGYEKKMRATKSPTFLRKKAAAAERARTRHPLRAKAREALRMAISRGDIEKKGICEKCHAQPTECHHEDYNKPLEIIELCKRCHAKIHYPINQ